MSFSGIFQNFCSAYELQHKNPVQKRVTPIPKAQYGGRHTVTMLPGNRSEVVLLRRFA